MHLAKIQKKPKKPTINKLPSKTHKEFAADTDVNNILKKFKKTGQLPDFIKNNPQYGDFSTVGDFMQSMQIVKQAELQFSLLDSSLRNKFRNDPAEFLQFMEDPNNVEESIKLGLRVSKNANKQEINETEAKASDNVAKPQPAAKTKVEQAGDKAQ